ncbi:MAG: bifunctional proline dehydrogenase/L-glutamate gamma-semialdehyde dehydrogenase, partial [Betaproteobacteria bacterium RIFCSPLOWO2_12_FULL_63_13]
MNDRMIFATPPRPVDPLRALIRKTYLADETLAIEALLDEARFEPAARARIEARARELVLAMRVRRRAGGIEVFLQEYGLDTEEGIVLLCLAEALLRIPDAATADRLIQDKLGSAHWERHFGRSDSLLVNASTWGLMLSGKLVQLDAQGASGLPSLIERLAARLGEPAVRVALKQVMAILGHQFVAGRTIEEALQRARAPGHRAYRHSFDMLGEAVLTRADAERYLESYHRAIAAAGTAAGAARTAFEAPGISIKLSALHPRFEYAQGERLMRELVPRVHSLAEAARAAGVGLTLDAEESDRLEPLLDVFEAVYRVLRDYEGFGLAVQAYQKRAATTVEWLIELARAAKRRVPLRLVKGAYWDSEIKRAQERGLSDYPVFTRKSASDVSYLACARRMAQAPAAVYPQFATHNAQTVSALLELMGGVREFEFQRLHGMGEALYAEIIGPEKHGVACRVYAPVGSHEDLLPYLVRRLLENGANTSFLHHALDHAIPVDALVADPIEKLRHTDPKPNPRLPLPAEIYSNRKNSAGLSLYDVEALVTCMRDMLAALALPPAAAPLIGGQALNGTARPVTDPADRRRTVGHVIEAGETAVTHALDVAASAQPGWDDVPPPERAATLERAADLFEHERATLLALLVREGGKCVPDADAEVREAADYCRYYAHLARAELARPMVLPGPTGEHNELRWHGRGVFACVSPWNFPLAIFTGQIAAALVAGNSVVAKPANQTPLVAHTAMRLLHQAGIPAEVLHFLPGPSARIGPRLLADPRLAGVAITGATETARTIHRRLAARGGPIVPLIAETGGLNAMIVDSSALPEQAAIDALRSAFNSAGQRCSALRVLFLQEEIAPRVLRLLDGAMEELSVGDPALLSTDVGPVIDDAARAVLEEHAARMRDQGKLLCRARLAPETGCGSFFAPQLFEIAALDLLEREVFGPILHAVRYTGNRLDAVIEAINRSGYGLTLGIHSRI